MHQKRCLERKKGAAIAAEAGLTTPSDSRKLGNNDLAIAYKL